MRPNEPFRLNYRPDIQGLRAIAVLMVIFSHADIPGFQGGFVGVDVFFVLSGFLISGLLITEYSETGSIDFVGFYSRRLQRLAPALLLMLLVISLTTYLTIAPSTQGSHYVTGATAALWMSNIHFALADINYFSPSSAENVFLHTWSLSVEEQFYLVWPWLVILALRNMNARPSSKRVTRPVVVFLSITLLSFLLCLYLSFNNAAAAYYLTTSRAWQFGAGALTYLLVSKLQHRSQEREFVQNVTGLKLFVWLGWLGLAALVTSTIAISDHSYYPGIWALLPTAGTVLLLMCGSTTASTVISKTLTTKPMVYIGDISYGWYLWHWPVLALSKTLNPDPSPLFIGFALIFSFAISVVSFNLLEWPIRRNRYLLSRPRVLGASAAVVIGIVVVSQLSLLSRGQEKIDSPVFEPFYAARLDLPALYSMGCDGWTESSEIKRCEFGSKEAQYEAMLIGDSMSAQWFSAFADIATRKNWRLTVVTKSSCPMVDHSYFYARIGRQFTECDLWRDELVQEIVNKEPDIVVMGSAPGYPFSFDEWESGTSRELEKISGSVNKIVILRSTPVLPFDALSCLQNQAWQKSRSSNIQIVDCSIAVEDIAHQHVYRALVAAASNYDNVEVVDVNLVVCPDGICAATQGPTVVFRDVQHLTDSFVESIGQEVLERSGVLGLIGPSMSTRVGSRDSY